MVLIITWQFSAVRKGNVAPTVFLHNGGQRHASVAHDLCLLHMLLYGREQQVNDVQPRCDGHAILWKNRFMDVFSVCAFSTQSWSPCFSLTVYVSALVRFWAWALRVSMFLLLLLRGYDYIGDKYRLFVFETIFWDSIIIFMKACIWSILSRVSFSVYLMVTEKRSWDHKFGESHSIAWNQPP